MHLAGAEQRREDLCLALDRLVVAARELDLYVHRVQAKVLRGLEHRQRRLQEQALAALEVDLGLLASGLAVGPSVAHGDGDARVGRGRGAADVERHATDGQDRLVQLVDERLGLVLVEPLR